jgi:hypothetical protein
MNLKLKISDDLCLPADALAQTQAILAIKGAGKTYAAMKMMEEVVKAEFQAVALDPTGVWWGLSADGDGRALPVLVMGGEHGDVPLEPTSGEVVAEYVVDSGRSVVLDLSLMRKAEMHRFMAAFLDKLYHYKATHRESMHVFFDEADTAAPQQPGPEQTKVLGAAEDVVRRGRSRGLGMTLITQRPAVLNKNLLEMCETLYVMRVVGSNDQDAIRKRVRVDADADSVERMMGSLATLKNGEAWVWSPSGLGVFKQIRFARKQTYDSSRSPRPGERVAGPKARAAIDLDDLTARIKATVERAKANDPALLRRRIAELERQALDRPAAEPRIVEKPVVTEAQVKRVEDVVGRLEREGQKRIEAADVLRQSGEQLRDTARDFAAALRAGTAAPPPRAVLPVRPIARTSPQTPPRATMPAGDGERLPNGERAVLTACAQYPDGIGRDELSVLIGYKRSSRDAYIQRLRGSGYVEASGDRIIATAEGLAALGPDFRPLPTGTALQRYWVNRLPEGERKILESLIAAYPGEVQRDALDDATGYKRSSRDAYLQRLKSRRLVVMVGRGNVRASDTLFDGVHA